MTRNGHTIANSEHALTLREADYPAAQYVPCADEYASPYEAVAPIAGHVAFYPDRVKISEA